MVDVGTTSERVVKVCRAILFARASGTYVLFRSDLAHREHADSVQMFLKVVIF